MPRYQLGSRFLWIKSLLVALLVGSELWPGFAKTPQAKILWGAALLTFLVSLAASPVGYADKDGIHYRWLIRVHHAPWQDVTKAEWIAEDMTLRLELTDGSVSFTYRGISALFGSRPRPEAVDFIERTMKNMGSQQRFVCGTSLA